ncbi:hypothetical protein R3W88_024102 [Solanum pinnatisectum]|uniref:GRF-type domain-containing protein n=1 Tax=Solanum pinnatisectum TaxID=50273 RepID=A0AAV9M1I5_9SOLN|nr:hypothetical protein R3W88_024102 [Solanum pinnatisectum]
MSQNSVNIEEADICKCGDYCRLKTSRSPLNSGRRFFGCKASNRKVKELEEERDSLKFQLNENEEKMMVLNKKLKEVKLQRD